MAVQNPIKFKVITIDTSKGGDDVTEEHLNFHARNGWVCFSVVVTNDYFLKCFLKKS